MAETVEPVSSLTALNVLLSVALPLVKFSQLPRLSSVQDWLALPPLGDRDQLIQAL